MNKTILELLVDSFKKATMDAYPELSDQADEVSIEVVQSNIPKFGHYQFNSAMKLARLLKLKPQDIAVHICAKVPLFSPDGFLLIHTLDIAGPGFINITLDVNFLNNGVNTILHDPRLGIPMLPAKNRLIIDFSSPNVAKEMHVGHLRSTIIGDCLARLFEFLGYNVLRINHLGDWGTSLGMLIAYLKEHHPKVIKGEEQADLTQLVHWYRESKKYFDADPAFKKESQKQVVQFQSGEPEASKAWHLICQISEKAYQEIYTLLDIKLIDRGESFYNPLLPGIIQDLESKGMVVVSDGAKCVYLEGFQNREGQPLPLMVQKSDGGFNYDTTDMATIRHRIDVEKGERLIYVTDAGQSTHFQMIFKAAEKAGYLDPKKVRVDHVAFGLVLGPDGKKFRTRAGESEKLIDLLTAAVEHAKKILMERSPHMPAEELNFLAKAIGIGAVKYADLSCHRTGDYMFSYDRMLKFEGNTAAFLMYAYVRIIGIKRKVNIDIEEVKKSHCIYLEHPAEISLGLHLLQFGETLNQVSNELLPNRLTDYLYALAEKFNAFFRDCRVEGTLQQSSRLLLCEATASVMKQGIEILGLQIVEKM
jgi:arginyl-tRNA synthetase